MRRARATGTSSTSVPVRGGASPTFGRWPRPRNAFCGRLSRCRLFKCGPVAVLSNAICQAVKPSGGLVVYSTCALSREENDGVVGNVLARHPAALGVIERSPFSDAQMAIGEPTEHGRIILPDHVMGECGSGWGPIYWTVLRRRPRQGDDDDDDDDE